MAVITINRNFIKWQLKRLQAPDCQNKYRSIDKKKKTSELLCRIWNMLQIEKKCANWKSDFNQLILVFAGIENKWNLKL